MNTADTHSLTTEQRRRSLIALFFSAFTVGVAFGGLAPLLALVMESRGVSTLLIGLNSSMSPIGVIAATFIVPWIIGRFGAVGGFLLGCGVVLVAILLFPVFEQLSIWFVLRFVMGAGLAVPWVVFETWINIVTPDSSRGRVMAIYTLVMAMGFAIGPGIIASVGSAGMMPYFLTALFFGSSLLPVYRVRGLAPVLDVTPHTRLSGLARSAPTIFGAALLAGVMDAAIFSFLPIYGLRLGFEESYAVLLVTLFLVGNLVLLYPMGWLADHVSRRGTMLACAAACTLGPAMMPFVFNSPFAMAAVLFFWGGGAWAIYGVALAMLGDRFPGAQLTVANAAFIMAFEAANVFAPPISGYTINILAPHGLMMFLSLSGATFFVLTAGRGIVRKLRGLG